MKQLNIKFYNREELSILFDIDSKDKNFARKIKDKLTNWGYSFDYSRKGVTILGVPTTANERLSEMMSRYYDLDIQIDTYAFATFLYALLTIEEFASMPWGEREVWLKEEFNIEAEERTLRRWCNKLLTAGTIAKDTSVKTYWMTYFIDGVKCREEIEIDNPQRQAYWKEFWELKKQGAANIPQTLWDKYHCCFYSCNRFIFAAWDDVDLLEEMLELVIQIAENEAIETKVEIVTRIIDEPKIKNTTFKF